MKPSSVARIDDHYRDLGGRFAVTEDPSFATLVVPNGNHSRPFHRWFRQKESFSADLVSAVLGRWRDGAGGDVFLDPFAGSGTALLAASDSQLGSKPLFAASYGVEANPFLHFVGATKIAARAHGAPGLAGLARDVVRDVRLNRVDPAPIPGLSSFANSGYFPPSDLRRLLQLRAAIDESGVEGTTRSVAHLCLSACLEPVSALRRDGRALRYEPAKVRAHPVEEFERRIEIAVDDLAIRAGVGASDLILGDGRRIDEVIPRSKSISVAVFSPPYLNNIDYTEVYKLEAWFLGFYRDHRAFRQQRLQTLRSHPSVRFPEVYGLSANGHKREFDSLIEPLLRTIPNNRYKVWREPLFRGYFDDMLETLAGIRKRLEPGGLVVYVVGNSLHGTSKRPLLVASDLLIAGLSELVGFDVVEIVIGRRPTRRSGGTLLRESVVALKPQAS
jgi:hypothetical protein